MKKYLCFLLISVMFLSCCGNKGKTDSTLDSLSSNTEVNQTSNTEIISESEINDDSNLQNNTENISSTETTSSNEIEISTEIETSTEIDISTETDININSDSNTNSSDKLPTDSNNELETDDSEVNSEVNSGQNQEQNNTSSNNNGSSNSPSNSGSNSQTPSTSEKDEIYIVEYYNEEVIVPKEVYKYGVTKLTTIIKSYALYNDGSSKLIDEYDYSDYNTSTYNASDDELSAESNTNTDKYMSYYQEVLCLVNTIRAEAGVEPLELDVTLCQAASMRALEIDYANCFDHVRPDGRSCFSVFDYYNINYMSAGENIAAGYPSPAAVVDGWKNSPGHYANMISPNFTKLGVGYSNSAPYGWSHNWVQLFTN